MGRPLLPIWKEFALTAPPGANKRSPDVICLHCDTVVHNARPPSLLRHAQKCQNMPSEVRGESRADCPRLAATSRQELKTKEQHPLANKRLNASDHEQVEMEERRRERGFVLGKRPHASIGQQDSLNSVLASIRDVMDQLLDCQKQDLQLRREELEYKKEALAIKMEDRRQSREEERRDRQEQREVRRKDKFELARIDNEKTLALLKAVVESSMQQRR